MIMTSFRHGLSFRYEGGQYIDIIYHGSVVDTINVCNYDSEEESIKTKADFTKEVNEYLADTTDEQLQTLKDNA